MGMRKGGEWTEEGLDLISFNKAKCRPVDLSRRVHFPRSSRYYLQLYESWFKQFPVFPISRYDSRNSHWSFRILRTRIPKLVSKVHTFGQLESRVKVKSKSKRLATMLTGKSSARSQQRWLSLWRPRTISIRSRRGSSRIKTPESARLLPLGVVSFTDAPRCGGTTRKNTRTRRRTLRNWAGNSPFSTRPCRAGHAALYASVRIPESGRIEICACLHASPAAFRRRLQAWLVLGQQRKSTCLICIDGVPRWGWFAQGEYKVSQGIYF